MNFGSNWIMVRPVGVKPRQGRGRAGFNDIESRQKIVRASFGAAQNAESPRVARRVQHDVRRVPFGAAGPAGGLAATRAERAGRCGLQASGSDTVHES
ncbi:hypothetical protein [Burkholderia sp. IMCC1007]|uniref:hypothetical protein n=1 Tax=Burkholderia sp. IMCC1007 TaxID=3004104 RepID=UPI0022B51852|nr:hypothetical protein [Burkholderia sp. IMCC1007]